jgi:hypothetical protein
MIRESFMDVISCLIFSFPTKYHSNPSTYYPFLNASRNSRTRARFTTQERPSFADAGRADRVVLRSTRNPQRGEAIVAQGVSTRFSKRGTTFGGQVTSKNELEKAQSTGDAVATIELTKRFML